MAPAAGGGAAGARHLTSVRTELAVYFGSDHPPVQCPFRFWSQHAHRFPTLATLAYKLLSGPPSSGEFQVVLGVGISSSTLTFTCVFACSAAASSETAYFTMPRKLLGHMVFLKQNMHHTRQLPSLRPATGGEPLEDFVDDFKAALDVLHDVE